MPKSKRDPAACHCVWHDDKTGRYRHEIAECPISVLKRNQSVLIAANDWRLLGRPPFDYDEIDNRFWRLASAVKSEGDWYANQPRPKDKAD